MAKTFLKKGLRPWCGDDAYLNAITLQYPEKLTQTFVAYSPVILDAGYIATAASPVTAAWGIALDAGHNSTASGDDENRVVPIFPNIGICANFLGAAAIDNALAAADLGNDFEVNYSATMVNATTGGWYILDASAGNESVRMISFYSDQALPLESITPAVATDVNARVTALWKSAIWAMFVA